MKRVFYIMIALVLPFCSVGAQTSVWNPDNGNGTFTNPIMWGDWPDPDVIRVGDDFLFCFYQYALCSRLPYCYLKGSCKLGDGRICGRAL